MSEDFYPFVDSGDPAPDNAHLVGGADESPVPHPVENAEATYTIRISVYDDMLSTPRVIVVEQRDVRTYLEDVTNTVYRTMKEQGGRLSLMIIRELVENFIHAQFTEPVISILDGGDTIRFADQGPGIDDKERAFEFGVTSADRSKKRYIRGTGAGLPMVQQYVENAGGAISVEDNLGAGTVVTVSVDPSRVAEIERAVSRGAAVRGGHPHVAVEEASAPVPEAQTMYPGQPGAGYYPGIPGAPGAVGAVPGYPGYMPQQPYGMGFAQPSAYPAPQQAYPPQGFTPASPDGQAPAQAPCQVPAQMPGGPNPYQQMYPGWPMQPPMGQFPPVAQAAQAPAPQIPQAQPAAQPTPGPYVSERGALALRFIAQNGKGGPTDLTRTYGNSDATWSRELDALSGTGLIHKRGQKYVLTDVGQTWALQNQ